MFCPNCGKQLPDMAQFCSDCGCSLQGVKKIQNVGNGVNPSTAIITSLSASQSAVANATPTGMIRIPLTNTYQDEKYTLGILIIFYIVYVTNMQSFRDGLLVVSIGVFHCFSGLF